MERRALQAVLGYESVSRSTWRASASRGGGASAAPGPPHVEASRATSTGSSGPHHGGKTRVRSVRDASRRSRRGFGLRGASSTSPRSGDPRQGQKRGQDHESQNEAQYGCPHGQTRPTARLRRSTWAGEPATREPRERTQGADRQNLAVNKKVIKRAVARRGGDTQYRTILPVPKGYAPKEDSAARSEGQAVLAKPPRGGLRGAGEPYVQLVAQDGPDVMEASRSNGRRSPQGEAVPRGRQQLWPKGRMRKTGKRSPSRGAPSTSPSRWERVIHSKAGSNC